MGCWAINSFGNDTAAEWLAELLGKLDLEGVRQAVTQALAGDGEIDSSDATEALVAIEVVAAALGRPTLAARDKPELLAWVKRLGPSPDASLVADSERALDRILGPQSELNELWEETSDYDEWRADVANLRARLQA